MNGRLVGAVVGLIVVGFGLAAIAYPERVMQFAGFAVAPTASVAQATAEVRAIYGGIFVVLGMWIVIAALRQSRQLLVFSSTLFLGAASGRLGGAYLAGSPGVWGWIGAIVEVVLGAALLSAAWSLQRAEDWASRATLGQAGEESTAASAGTPPEVPPVAGTTGPPFSS